MDAADIRKGFAFALEMAVTVAVGMTESIVVELIVRVADAADVISGRAIDEVVDLALEVGVDEVRSVVVCGCLPVVGRISIMLDGKSFPSVIEPSVDSGCGTSVLE